MPEHIRCSGRDQYRAYVGQCFAQRLLSELLDSPWPQHMDRISTILVPGDTSLHAYNQST